MFGLEQLNRTQRLILGIIILLIVDVIWVVSAELTVFIFKTEDYDKPFFTTYIKTVMFSVYLFGFIVWKPWRDQCCRQRIRLTDSNERTPITPQVQTENVLGSPIYVPVKYENYESHTSGGESDDASNGGSCKSVRFSNLSEVRQLSDEFAVEHNLARLSYQASIEMEERLNALENKLPLKMVMKLAFFFCLLWFFANYTYQVALKGTEAAVVNVLSSTSGLFTLICAAIFPSGAADKFTLSKLAAVLLSLGGVVMVCLSEFDSSKSVPVGSMWALGSAGLYAFYLTMVKRSVQNEDQMDIPMFFGFVGMFCAVVVWPGFFILHYLEEETFQWPTGKQWMFILINGAIGTVLSEFLWLWGCFLTSSLIATLSLSLVTPLTMLADGVVKKIDYSPLFYVGTIPVFVSFFVVSLLIHWENWDPVMFALRKLLSLCRRREFGRVRELDREQAASLITEESHH